VNPTRTAARAARLATARTRRVERRAVRRAALRGALAAFGRAVRPVLPILLVTGFAGIGQILWNLDYVAPAAWGWPARIALACGAAGAVESISLNVQWHAHDAYVQGFLTRAARLRRASYCIAAVVAGINYSHFAGPGGAPTPAAIMFALFSASSPWLWGLHTRRVREIHLAQQGARVDVAGTEFAPIRWRVFPLRTFRAWRWSIDYGITDPQRAWDGYTAEWRATKATRQTRGSSFADHTRQTARHLTRRPTATPPAPDARPEDTVPPAEPPARSASVALATAKTPVVRADTARRPVGRRARRAAGTRPPGQPVRSDGDVLAVARAHAAQHGAITSRTAFRTATGTGGDRSERLFDLYQRETTGSA